MQQAVALARTPRDRIAVRYRLDAAPEPARILTREPRTLDGAPVEVTLPHLSRFVGTSVVDRPWGYAVPEAVALHLARHGLVCRHLDAPVAAEVEVPWIDAVRETDSRSILEAPGEVLVTSRWERRTEDLPAGTWVVPTGQPLGAIAVYLCEAESDDGLVAARLAPRPRVGERFPALRLPTPLA